jgi:hypothetical protein
VGVRQFTGHRSGRELRPTSISELSKGWFSPPSALLPRAFDTSVSEERVARARPGHSSVGTRPASRPPCAWRPAGAVDVETLLYVLPRRERQPVVPHRTQINLFSGLRRTRPLPTFSRPCSQVWAGRPPFSSPVAGRRLMNIYTWLVARPGKFRTCFRIKYTMRPCRTVRGDSPDCGRV